VPLVRSSLQGGVATVVLDDPAKRNALSAALIGELLEALGSFQESRARAVVLRASPGAKTWSAGHDVKELPTDGRDPLTWSDPLRVLVRRIEHHPAPVIAVVEGGVWGGACELLMACDLVLAAENATFAITPARLGVPYNVAGTLTFMRSTPLPAVKELLFRARPIEAARALAIGMVNHVLPAGEIDAVLEEILGDILQNAPLTIALLKEEIQVLAESHPLNPEAFERVQELRRRIYDSADYREGIRSFLEKRKPVFRGE
jgi:methylmalonyl-CoA decarboxylase